MVNVSDNDITRRGVITIAGAVVTLPLMNSLSGCSRDAPRSLSSYMSLLETISEMIIPETDTPGAKSAGVPAYIDAVITDFFTANQRREFKDALKIFDDMAYDRGAENFVSAPKTSQVEILSVLDMATDGNPGRGIWRHLRNMTLFGYYTSEVATQELAFEEVPGRYDGCVPFANVGRAWLERGV